MGKRTNPKPRGSSNAGRPKKDGERKPCGRLVQKVEPNAKVVELRRAMLGDANASLTTAESPMGLALARGWITEEQHRAGVSYAMLWRRSHPQHRVGGSLQEAPERFYDPRPIAQMGSVEIAAAFEKILSDSHRSETSEAMQTEARKRYNTQSLAMRPDEQNEVFLCFCLESWPQWILQRCAGRFDTSWERKYQLLVAGLGRITQNVVAKLAKRA